MQQVTETQTAVRFPLEKCIGLIQSGTGFSYNIPLDRFSPNNGYMASIQGNEYRHFLSDCWGDNINLSKVIHAYRNNHKSELSNRRVYLGAWIDGNEVVFDTSVHMSNLRAAKAFARRNNQRAIWDCRNNCNIYV